MSGSEWLTETIGKCHWSKYLDVVVIKNSLWTFLFECSIIDFSVFLQKLQTTICFRQNDAPAYYTGVTRVVWNRKLPYWWLIRMEQMIWVAMWVTLRFFVVRGHISMVFTIQNLKPSGFKEFHWQIGRIDKSLKCGKMLFKIYIANFH